MSKSSPVLFRIYKPYGMLSQFTREHPSHVTLADLDYDFAKDIYPIGRLDRDSEGLLLLSNDKTLNQQLLHPTRKVAKTYLAQVEGIPTPEAFHALRKGPVIRVKGKDHICAPCEAQSLTSTPLLPERDPPIRFRKNKPTSWIKIVLREGKNRQVRKMLATVGFPVLRLVRTQIGPYELSSLLPGEVLQINRDLPHSRTP